jgi:hypothetical protein
MTTAEITALGPCPACGHLRHVFALCGCGHSVIVHLLGSSKGATVRTGCTHGDPAGQCRCKRFTEVSA